MEKDETLEERTYEEGGDFVQITKQGAGLLKTFKQFVAHHNTQGQPYEEDDWTTITQAEYNKLRSMYANTTPPAVKPSVVQLSVCPPPVIDLVKNFKRG